MSTAFRKTLVCLVAVFAMSAASASSALAVDEPTFKFTGEKGFTSTSLAGTLETDAGLTVTCSSDTDTGEIEGTSPSKKVTNVVITFHGCKSAGHKCSSIENPVTEAEKETIVTGENDDSGELKHEKLEGELSLLTDPEKTGEEDIPPAPESEKVGLDLKPKAPATLFADFDCGSTIDAEVRGSVIGEITPLDTPVTELTLTYNKVALVKGEQEWENDFSVAEDVLETKLTTAGAFKESAIETVAKIKTKTGTVEVSDDPS
jgi:hypothetical protein